MEVGCRFINALSPDPAPHFLPGQCRDGSEYPEKEHGTFAATSAGQNGTGGRENAGSCAGWDQRASMTYSHEACTDHFVDDQGCHRHIAQPSILRHGRQPIRLLRRPRRRRLGDGGIHEADGAIIVLAPLHAHSGTFFLAAIDGRKGWSWVDMTRGQRGGPFTPGISCHRHVAPALVGPVQA